MLAVNEQEYNALKLEILDRAAIPVKLEGFRIDQFDPLIKEYFQRFSDSPGSNHGQLDEMKWNRNIGLMRGILATQLDSQGKPLPWMPLVLKSVLQMSL